MIGDTHVQVNDLHLSQYSFLQMGTFLKYTTQIYPYMVCFLPFRHISH